MRFAIVTETYPPEINGVALTVQSLVARLREHDHAVTVVRPRQADERDPDSEEEMLVASHALPRYPGLRFGWPAGSRLHRRWLAAPPRAVYIATEGPLGMSALRVARHLRIPALTGFHTRFDAYLGHYGAGWLAPVASAWLRRFHNRAQATLVPTRALQEELTARGFDSVRLLARGVDTRRFAPAKRSDTLRRDWGIAPDGLAVIHVGRLAAEKNLDLLLTSFAAIRARRSDAKLILVGDGPLRADVSGRVPDAVFCGTQTGDALAAHYASSDLFVFPSLSETYGNVVLESLASGVPVFAFAQGAALEHVRNSHNGGTVAAGDPAGFRAGCVALAMDAALAGPMKKAARSSVARLDPSQVAIDFEVLVDELAGASDGAMLSRTRTRTRGAAESAP